MLEEIGLPYTVHAVDINKDEQFTPEFLKIAPNNKIPAIVDRDTGIALMESGAIMIYLADKSGKLLAKEGERRYRAIEWLMWQMSGIGPVIGQTHHFVKNNPGKAPYAEERFTKETHRHYKVLNTRLEGREFVADEYSIADIAIWPWLSRFEWHKVDMKQYPNVKRWYETIAARPAVKKGYSIPKDMGRSRCRKAATPLNDVVAGRFARRFRFRGPGQPAYSHGDSYAAFVRRREPQTPPWPSQKPLREPTWWNCCTAPQDFIKAAHSTRQNGCTGRRWIGSPPTSTHCISAACCCVSAGASMRHWTCSRAPFKRSTPGGCALQSRRGSRGSRAPRGSPREL